MTRPEHVAVVGDRLTTDVMMANMMGSYAVWVRDGVVPVEETSVVSLTVLGVWLLCRPLTLIVRDCFLLFFSPCLVWSVQICGFLMLIRRIQFARLEKKFAGFLQRRGYEPPEPASPFED